MASDSVNERCAQAVLEALREIEAGADYHITPDDVVRCAAWEEAWLDSSKNALYFLIPDEDVRSELDYCHTEEIARYMMVLCHRLRVSTENPFRVETPDRPTLQGRMVQDVTKKLRSDLTLDGQALHHQIPLVSRSPQDTYLEGWASALLTLEIQLQYRDAQP